MLMREGCAGCLVFVLIASLGVGEFKGAVEGVSITVEKAAGEMCERCWSHAPTVGSDAQFPHLCARCAAVMKLDLG